MYMVSIQKNNLENITLDKCNSELFCFIIKSVTEKRISVNEVCNLLNPFLLCNGFVVNALE